MKNDNGKLKKNIEQIAIEHVIEFEKKRRKSKAPRNVSKEHVGYDVLSKGRKIEVKGSTAKYPGFVLINEYNFRALQREDNFWVYVVYDILGKPKLIPINKTKTLRLLKFSLQWELPIRKADFNKNEIFEF